jgi:hypothetical protein
MPRTALEAGGVGALNVSPLGLQLRPASFTPSAGPRAGLSHAAIAATASAHAHPPPAGLCAVVLLR